MLVQVRVSTAYLVMGPGAVCVRIGSTKIYADTYMEWKTNDEVKT